MKKLLTLVLCWLIAFSAIAETTLKAKTALSVAGSYVTSMNKVDGSFEDGTTGWVASVGTIVKTASTEMQGNNVGVWSGTGTGTLDLQWTATASNTYTASVQVKLDVPADYSFCAVVNGVETGCKSLAGYVANKIYKLQVDADSVIGTSFYLRLKHTGSGAFSAIGDDGKIEPFSPQYVSTATGTSVIQSYQDGTEWTSYTPTVTNLTGFAHAPTGKWRRNGDSMEVQISLRKDATAGSSSNRVLFSLPSGYLIDTSKISGRVDDSLLGYFSGYNVPTTAQYLVGPIHYGGSLTSVGALTPSGSSKLLGTSFNADAEFNARFSVPIRGWSSSPTLLALPTSKENVFSAKISSTGIITSTNSDWINSVTLSDTSLYTINITKLGLTVAPQVNVSFDRTSAANDALREIMVASVSSTSIAIRTKGNGAPPDFEALPFEIIIQKQSPDYTAPGVFVGNVQPEWQYDIKPFMTGTATGFSVVRALATVKKFGDGSYRVGLKGYFTVTSSANTTTTQFSISGLNSDSVADNILTGMHWGAGATTNWYPVNTTTFACLHNSATVTGYSFNGEITVSSKPTWATNTP